MDLGNLIFELKELLDTVPEQSGSAMEATMDLVVALLKKNTELAEYEVARFLAYRPFKKHIQVLLTSEHRSSRLRALGVIEILYPPGAAAKHLRKLVKDPDLAIRSRSRRIAMRMHITDVAIQAPRNMEPWATAGQSINNWHRHGWTFGTVVMPLRQDSLARHGLPVVDNNNELAALLGFAPADLPCLLRPGTVAGAPYVQFSIDKANGSKRLICAPRAQLKIVQRGILEKILGKIPTHEACHGFVRGRSTLTNAKPHQGAAVIIKMDLENFFPTINYRRVKGFFTYCGYDHEVAGTLASLCTFRATSQAGKAIWPGMLPQGAPSSPALANLICVRMDKRLQGVAERFGATYTRYADDLTFSFASEPTSLGRFHWWVDQICSQEGFSENLAKRRVLRPNNQQRITGVVVNSGLFVPRKARRQFRAILNNCRKHGVASQARGHADFPAYLRGFAAYLHMVQPALGAKLRRYPMKAALFQDIVNAPDDFVKRTAYAELLTMQGDSRGEFMQAYLLLEERMNPATRKRAQESAKQLLKKKRQHFLQGLELLQDARFKYGFVDAATLNAEDLPPLIGRLFGQELPTNLTLQGATPSALGLLVDQGLLGRLRTLKLVGAIGSQGIAHLIRTPQLRSIRCLNLSRCDLHDATLAPLLDSDDFQCSSLTLSHNEVGNATANRLATCGTLNRLFVNSTILGDEGLERMAFARDLQSLEGLAICNNEELTEQCLETLHHNDCLPGLRWLDFYGHSFDVSLVRERWKGVIY